MRISNNFRDLKIKDRFIVANFIAAAFVTSLIVAGFITWRIFNHEITVEQEANLAWAKLYGVAEQAIIFNDLEPLEREVTALLKDDKIESVSLYRLDMEKPVAEYTKNSGHEKITFKFQIYGNYYDPANDDEFFSSRSHQLKHREKIGSLNIYVSNSILNRSEIDRGLLALAVLFLIGLSSMWIGLWINKKTILRPINEILFSLDKLGKGSLKLAIEKTDNSELGDIQTSMESMRIRLLELAKKEVESRNDLITSKKEIEGITAANNFFISTVANESLPYISNIGITLHQISKRIIPTDPTVGPMLEAVEKELDNISDKISDLVSAAELSILNIELNYETININKLIGAIIDNCQFLATKKAMNLSFAGFNSTDESLDLYTDKKIMEKIIYTIVQYILNKSSLGTILLEPRKYGEEVSLNIICTGVVQEGYNFEKLFSKKNGIHKSDTSISAAMILVERIGGTINVATMHRNATVLEISFSPEKVISHKKSNENVVLLRESIQKSYNTIQSKNSK